MFIYKYYFICSMRTTTQFVRMSITKEAHDMIKEDRKHFQEVIGGGKWSLSDVIIEYKKILNQLTGDK